MGKVLNRNFQIQTTYYYCGPAATRVALSCRGVIKTQKECADSLGTTVNGTDSSNNVTRTLNAYLGAGKYNATFIGGSDASAAQKSQFQKDVKLSVDDGFAVVANVVGPIHTNDGSNYSYPGGHYVCISGYDDSGNVLVSDVAVREYWAPAAAVATWIAGRSYSKRDLSVVSPPVTPPDVIVGRGWPTYMPPNHYFGLITGPTESHGGVNDAEKADVLAIQVRLQQLGFAPATPGWADGIFEQPTADAVAKWQHTSLPGTTRFGEVWSDDWAVLFAAQTVPPPVVVPPSGTTIYGVDLSNFDSDRGNSPAIVAQYRAAGISFVSHKISEVAQGPTVIFHEKCGEMLTAAKDSGMPFISGYIVVRTTASAQFQVAEYIKGLDRYLPWWRTFPGFFHQIDLEKWSYDDVPASLGNEVVAELRKVAPQPILNYASKGQYGNSTLTVPRWNAAYPLDGTADEYRNLYVRAGGNAGTGWVIYGTPATLPEIWQYSSNGVVAGQGKTDVNAFRGSEADFFNRLGFTVPVPPVVPPVVTPPPVIIPPDVTFPLGAASGGIFLFKEESSPTVWVSDGFHHRSAVSMENVARLVSTGAVAKPLGKTDATGWISVVKDGTAVEVGGERLPVLL